MQTNNKDSKVSYPKTAKQIEAELKEATREIKDLDKQKRSSSFKKLINKLNIHYLFALLFRFCVF